MTALKLRIYRLYNENTNQLIRDFHIGRIALILTTLGKKIMAHSAFVHKKNITQQLAWALYRRVPLTYTENKTNYVNYMIDTHGYSASLIRDTYMKYAIC